MSTGQTSDDRGSSVLAGLLAPLRLPERVLAALDELRPLREELTRVREQTEPLDELRPMREELTRVREELASVREELASVREQTEPLGDLLPMLAHLEDALGTRLDAVHGVVVALESDESHLNRTVKGLGAKVGALSEVVAPVDDRLARVERAVHGLAGEVVTIGETLIGVKDDIQRTTGLRGDRGVMERARDALTGGSAEPDRPASQAPAEGRREEPPT